MVMRKRGTGSTVESSYSLNGSAHNTSPPPPPPPQYRSGSMGSNGMMSPPPPPPPPPPPSSGQYDPQRTSSIGSGAGNYSAQGTSSLVSAGGVFGYHPHRTSSIGSTGMPTPPSPLPPHRTGSLGSATGTGMDSPLPPPPPPPHAAQAHATTQRPRQHASQPADNAPLSPTTRKAASPSLVAHVSRLEAELDSVMSMDDTNDAAGDQGGHGQGGHDDSLHDLRHFLDENGVESDLDVINESHDPHESSKRLMMMEEPLNDLRDRHSEHEGRYEERLNDVRHRVEHHGAGDQNELVMGDGAVLPSPASGGLRRRVAQPPVPRRISNEGSGRHRQQKGYRRGDARRSGRREGDASSISSAEERSRVSRSSRRSRASRRSRRSRRRYSPSTSPSPSPSPSRSPARVIASPIHLTALVGLSAAIFGCLGGYLVSHRRQTDAIVHTFAAMERMKHLQASGVEPDGLEGMKAGWTSKGKKSASEKGSVPSSGVPPHLEEEEEDESQSRVKDYIRNMDQKAVIDRFGKGPHKVMITVSIPEPRRGEGSTTDSDKDPRRRFFVETAPLESMPHSILAFLDMCEKGLFNGMQFNRITSNVDSDEVRGIWSVMDDRLRPVDESVKARLKEEGRWPHALAHPEVSPDTPHRMHTVGFVDGIKPGLFISTSGRNQINLKGVSAFGRIVGGTETVDRLMELISGGSGTLADPATIRFVRIVE